MRPPPSRSTSLTLAVLTLLVLSACSQLPLGADGHLTNNWPAHSTPTGWSPKAGDCHHGYSDYLPRAAYTVTDCDSEHSAQTFHVSEVTGPAAEATTAPARNTDAFRSLWATCDQQLTAFLGGQWRDRYLRPRVSLPGRTAWDAGIRWHSCVATTFMAFDIKRTLQRSIKDAYDTDPTLQFGCAQLSKGGGHGTPASCTEPHNTEYAGHFPSPLTYPEMLAELGKSSYYDACLKVISGFGNDTTVSRSLKNAGSAWPLR